MKKINFTNAIVTAQASVEIDGVSHDVTPAVIEGATLPTPDNINQLQNNVEEAILNPVVESIECKNKFNMNGNILESIDYTSGTNVLESGKIKATANIANGNGKGQIIQLKPNTVYTYSVKISSFEVDGSTSLRISPVNSEGNAVGYLLDQSIICEVGKVYSYSFTTSDTGKIWVMLNGISNVEDYSILKYVVYDYIQIEEGSTATNYSEYKGIGYTSGQNANGKWVKYDDGRMECWGTKTYSNVAMTNPSYGKYYAVLEKIAFPQTFKSAPACLIDVDYCQPGYAVFLLSSDGPATTTFAQKKIAFCDASVTATALYVNYHAYGYWK